MTVPARYTLTEAHFKIAELEREKARLQQALEAARREAGRAQDVRVNRTRIIGNIALIADEALAGQPADAEGPDTPADDEPCSCCDGKGCAYCTPADNNEVPAGCAPRVREITEPSRTDGIGATPADSQPEDQTT